MSLLGWACGSENIGYRNTRTWRNKSSAASAFEEQMGEGARAHPLFMKTCLIFNTREYEALFEGVIHTAR